MSQMTPSEIVHELDRHIIGKYDAKRAVAIAMRNYPEWVLAFTAITSIGAVAVAMNGHWQADELLYGLQDSGASVVLADAERLARLAQPQVRAALPQLHRH